MIELFERKFDRSYSRCRSANPFRLLFTKALYRSEDIIITRGYFVHVAQRRSLHWRARPTTLIRYQAHIALFNAYIRPASLKVRVSLPVQRVRRNTDNSFRRLSRDLELRNYSWSARLANNA